MQSTFLFKTAKKIKKKEKNSVYDSMFLKLSKFTQKKKPKQKINKQTKNKKKERKYTNKQKKK